MAFSPQHKLYLTIVIVIGIIAGSFFGGALPFLNKLEKDTDKFMELKKDLLVIDKKSGFLKETKEEYKKIEGGINLVTNSLLDEDRVIDFIEAIESIAIETANTHEIRVISSQSSSPKSKASGGLVFQFSLWGTFPNLLDFLNKLENMQFFIDVESIQISKAEKTPGQEGVSFPVSIKTDLKVRVYTR